MVKGRQPMGGIGRSWTRKGKRSSMVMYMYMRAHDVMQCVQVMTEHGLRM